MAYVLDESSFRTDKTAFPTAKEAQDRAAEAARILGRPITVYELLNQTLHFAFRVHPDGRKCTRNPLPDHEPIEPTAPAVLGRRELFDMVAEVLERQGRFDLAAALDADGEVVANVGPDAGIRSIVDQLKRDDV